MLDTISTYCTKDTCDVMNAGEFEYVWFDERISSTPIRVSAPEYIDYLMTWIQDLFDTPTIFPSNNDVAFGKNFRKTLKKIFTRLFRVLAHIYHSHYDDILTLEEAPHLNTLFKHFVLFSREHKLINESDMEPLKQIMTILLTDTLG